MLVYADGVAADDLSPDDQDGDDSDREWFLRFSDRVNILYAASWLYLCNGEAMARNPKMVSVA